MAGNATFCEVQLGGQCEVADSPWQPLLQYVDTRNVICAIVLACVLYEQIRLQLMKQWLPGPLVVVPFLGSALQMLFDPTTFWDNQAKWAMNNGMSWNMLLGGYILFIRDTELSHRVFSNVKPDAFHLIGHPFGKKLFGEHNMIMMFGDEHKDLRRRIAPLFTLKALGVYVNLQEAVVRKHIAKWLDMANESKGRPLVMRHLLRDMNLETSQTVFAGPYLTPEVRQQFMHDYSIFNAGVMALPIDLPGFTYWRAVRAVQRIIAILADCAKQSKAAMSAGVQPRCLMDFWMVDVVRETAEAEAAGQPPPPFTSDWEVGQHIFDFLFAAQDASTSSLVWLITLLESHPEVYERVKAEISAHHPDPSAPFPAELLREKLPYCESVMREVLRLRPPATLVPHIAAVDFPITPDYTIPKGTVVFPSTFESSFQGFSNPHAFDPDRFSPERREHEKHRRNWLMFGAGPHQCVGQRYAMNHLMLFMCCFVSTVKWSRVRTRDCDDIAYVPTIVPKDGGRIVLEPAAA